MIINFDTKYFDYSKIKEPLIAIPFSVFKKNHIRTLKTLSKKDIQDSYNLAIKEKVSGKLTSARDFLKTL
jgi:hypothetical protein